MTGSLPPGTCREHRLSPAETGIVEFPVAVALQARRQILAFQTEQRQMVMAKLGVQQQFGAVWDADLGELVGEAQVVVGEEGQDLFLRVEHLLAGAVVGQAETDEAVMHQAVPVRFDGGHDLGDWHVRGVVDGRRGRLLIVGVRLRGVVFKNEERFFRHAGGKLREG